MPPAVSSSLLPASTLAGAAAARQNQGPKSPNRVLAEAEAQWIFTEAELANTPSIQDGMTQAEEREIRTKGVNFIVQVGIMLKLPQLTLSTAAVFFQRFLMRASLKSERDGIPRLHHYQSAATALFLATKVEESCRKINELVIAFCRVAQKNPNLVIDQQSKDWWRWRDCILHNEDVLLETLCFDLTVERPHRQLFDMLKWYRIEHNKRLRNAAWSFVTDSNNTQLCLLCNSRTIATAALWAACKYCDVQLPDDAKGRPWWEVQHVRLRDIRKAVEHMCDSYDAATQRINGIATGNSSTADGAEGERSIYVGLFSSSNNSLDGTVDCWDATRLRNDSQTQDSRSPFMPPPGSERRHSSVSSAGVKREYDDEENASGKESRRPHANGNAKPLLDRENAKRQRLESPTGVPDGLNGVHDLKHREETLKLERSNQQEEARTACGDGAIDRLAPRDEGPEGSEEGELEE